MYCVVMRIKEPFFWQELLIEVYRSIGEPDSLYGCGGETMTSPLTR